MKTKQRIRRHAQIADRIKGKDESINKLKLKNENLEKLIQIKKSFNRNNILPPSSRGVRMVNLTSKPKLGYKDILSKSFPEPTKLPEKAIDTSRSVILAIGRFGEVSLALFKQLGINVAIKRIVGMTVAEVECEAKITTALSGISHFPYCFGMWRDCIVLEAIGSVINGEFERAQICN